MFDLLIAAGHHVRAGFVASVALVGAVMAEAATTGTDAVLLVILAIIGGLPATIAAIGAIVIGLRNSAKVAEVAKAVDGVTSHLVAATERGAMAEGIAVGIATERADPQSPVDAVLVNTHGPTQVKIVQDPGAAAIRVKTDTPESKP